MEGASKRDLRELIMQFAYNWRKQLDSIHIAQGLAHTFDSGIPGIKLRLFGYRPAYAISARSL